MFNPERDHDGIDHRKVAIAVFSLKPASDICRCVVEDVGNEPEPVEFAVRGRQSVDARGVDQRLGSRDVQDRDFSDLDAAPYCSEMELVSGIGTAITARRPRLEPW